MDNFKLDFLKSRRFWVMVIGVVMFYLHTKNLIGKDEITAIEMFISGFIGIRTIDRFGENASINNETLN